MQVRRVALPLLLAGMLTVTVGGCSPNTSPPQAATPSSAPASKKPTLAPCATPSESVATHIRELTTASGLGATVTETSAVFDEATGFWHVGGTIEDPASTDGVIGVWATVDDPTAESFDGAIWATTGAAEVYSTAPLTVETYLSEQRARIISCHSKLSKRHD